MKKMNFVLYLYERSYESLYLSLEQGYVCMEKKRDWILDDVNVLP